MKADVFFFVTTIAVVVVSIAFCIFLYYAIQAIRAFHHLVDRAHTHVTKFEDGVDSFKRGVSANMHFLVRTVGSVASTLMKPRKKKETPSGP